MSTTDNDETVLDDDDPNGGDWQQLPNIVYDIYSFAVPDISSAFGSLALK